MGCGNHTAASDANEMLDDGDYGFIMQETGGGGGSGARGKRSRRGRRKHGDDGYARLLDPSYVPPADAQDGSASDADDDRPSDRNSISRGNHASFVF